MKRQKRQSGEKSHRLTNARAQEGRIEFEVPCDSFYVFADLRPETVVSVSTWPRRMNEQGDMITMMMTIEWWRKP